MTLIDSMSKLSCREASRLTLAREDRSLTLGEQAALRAHQTICEACRRFEKQVDFMREAMGRWRRYGQDEEGPKG